MRKPKSHAFKYPIIFLILATMGCSKVGQQQLDHATNALKANNPSGALVYATEAILKNPNFAGAKRFMRDNADDALAKVNGYLNSTRETTDLAEQQTRFTSYQNMVKFYDNLETIGLPIVGKKRLLGLIKGWKWTTPIQDLRPDLEASRVAAREGFYKAGLEAIQQGDLALAKSRMDQVVTQFALADSEEQSSDRQQIAKDFVGWAAQHHQSTSPEALLKGIQAYEIALGFHREEEAAVEGLATVKQELSEVYLQQGLAKEKEDTIDSLKAAIDLFQNALKYHAANTLASEGIPRVKTRIATIYCDQGEQQERKGTRGDLIAAHGLYEEALKWDSGYNRATKLKASFPPNSISCRTGQQPLRLHATDKSLLSFSSKTYISLSSSSV